MLGKELKQGDIFSIENIGSRPQLKLKDGYVDIQDDIVNKSGNCDDCEAAIISVEEIMHAWNKEENYNYGYSFVSEMVTIAKYKYKYPNEYRKWRKKQHSGLIAVITDEDFNQMGRTGR